MRRSLLLLAALCLPCLSASAHANTIGAGVYTLQNAFAGGYALTGTVTINSAGNATGADLTFKDANVVNTVLPYFNQVYSTIVYNGLSQNYLTSSTNAGQIALFLDTNANANGVFDLCLGYTQCGTSTGTVAPSTLQIYGFFNSTTLTGNVGLGLTNLTSGYLAPASTVAVTSTPEPSSIIMLGTGVIGIFGATRLRLSSKSNQAQV